VTTLDIQAIKKEAARKMDSAVEVLQKEFAGLDTQLAAARTIYPSLNNGTTPSRTLEQLVAEGRCGIKSGRGFWDWTPDSARAAVQA